MVTQSKTSYGNKAQASMTCDSKMHRWFHPLCGSHPVILLALLAHNGPPSLKGVLPTSVALASALGRFPFTAAEIAWTAVTHRKASLMAPPVFIIGHMRSGTTHLHNVLSHCGQFNTVPPLIAGLPWEARSFARMIRPLVEQYFPEHRLIDNVALESSSPTEDEVALANMAFGSYYHAFYFARNFKRNYCRALCPDEGAGFKKRRRCESINYYARKMSMLAPDKQLLLKSPAYTAEVAMLRTLWPNAKFIHIYRNPYVVFESTKHMLSTLVRELSVQACDDIPIGDVVLETYPRIMQRLLKDTAVLPAENVVHVRFEDFEAEPLEEVERIFTVLDLENIAAERPHMKTYLDTIRHYKKNAHRFTDESVEKVSRHWGRFVTHWRYQPPPIVCGDHAYG
jgi:hypothetical protein